MEYGQASNSAANNAFQNQIGNQNAPRSLAPPPPLLVALDNGLAGLEETVGALCGRLGKLHERTFGPPTELPTPLISGSKAETETMNDMIRRRLERVQAAVDRAQSFANQLDGQL